MTKYTVNTNVLKSALNLVIIKNNISPYYRKSAILQIEVTEFNQLKLNTESYNLCSEIRLEGKLDGDNRVSVFVDSVLFQSLINTITDNTITFDFVESGIDIHTNSSVLKVSKLIDMEDMTLNFPVEVDNIDNSVDISSDVWKFISQYQASMLGTGMAYPIYRNIWFSNDGTVVAGDYETETFTKSKQMKGFAETCLISDMILNLLLSMPEGSKVIPVNIGDNKSKYVIVSDADSYTYRAEFEPLYESDEHVGSYMADSLMSVMTSDKSVKVDKSQLISPLNQIKLFGNTMVELTFNGSELELHSQNVNCKTKIDGKLKSGGMEFLASTLLKVLNNLNEDTLNMGFAMQKDKPVGINIWNDVLTITVGRR